MNDYKDPVIKEGKLVTEKELPKVEGRSSVAVHSKTKQKLYKFILFATTFSIIAGGIFIYEKIERLSYKQERFNERELMVDLNNSFGSLPELNFQSPTTAPFNDITPLNENRDSEVNISVSLPDPLHQVDPITLSRKKSIFFFTDIEDLNSTDVDEESWDDVALAISVGDLQEDLSVPSSESSEVIDYLEGDSNAAEGLAEKYKEVFGLEEVNISSRERLSTDYSSYGVIIYFSGSRSGVSGTVNGYQYVLIDGRGFYYNVFFATSSERLWDKRKDDFLTIAHSLQPSTPSWESRNN